MACLLSESLFFPNIQFISLLFNLYPFFATPIYQAIHVLCWFNGKLGKSKDMQ